MKINLITGGSGFVGRYLIKSLLDSGETVWVLVRPLGWASSDRRSHDLFPEFFKKYPQKFRAIDGDILKDDLGIGNNSLQELLKNEVFLWHLAANLSFSRSEKEQASITNIRGTMNAVNLANKVARLYIHMSTAYVCGDTHSVFSEDDLDVGQKFRNHYESSKFEGEKYVRENCNVPRLIFRPSIIMGNAYEGKAEGCTFGYYRFAYMIFRFKRWLTEKLLGDSFLAKNILLLLGSGYDKKNDILIAPWLIVPCPKNGTVDIIPIDYVIESMMRCANNPIAYGKTFHLTNPIPPSVRFCLSAGVEDFNYRKVRYVEIPPGIFKPALRVFYYVFFPLRKKIISAMWFMPYIIRPYRFSHKNSQALELPESSPITRDYLRKIHAYAQKDIFSNTDLSKKL